LTEDLSFLAASPQMVRIRQQILQIAPVDVPVFICGESGVGKEVVARMIHMRSTRRNQPFLKVNCAAGQCAPSRANLSWPIRAPFFSTKSLK
jgi:DNA-binding NtrC family response regulator